MRTLTLISLTFGLASTGTLLLAVATDYWLFTSEPINFEEMVLGGQADLSEEEFPPETLDVMELDYLGGDGLNDSVPIIIPTAIKLHSGLWRVCVYYEELGVYMCFSLSHCCQEFWAEKRAISTLYLRLKSSHINCSS